jgi:four helix bundle protein
MKTFEELDCWKKATELRRKISKLVKTFPADEKYKLTSQVTRASRSVTANIAEGYGRFHYQEYTQFCRNSRGSLYEVLDHLIVANDEGYITDEVLKSFRSDLNSCLAVLNGFINYLQRAKSSGKSEEPESTYLTGDNSGYDAPIND